MSASWKGVAAAAVLTAVAAAGAWAPALEGQARDERPRARVMQLITGRGSEIGVSIRDLDESEGSAAAAGRSGVLVEEVTAGGPAATAGVKKGDVVVEFDGERVRSARQFSRLVEETALGRKVPTVVSRDGQRVTVTVEPSESDRIRFGGELDAARMMRDFDGDFSAVFPPAPPAPPAPPRAPAVPPVPPVPAVPNLDRFMFSSQGRLGITISSLSDQLAGYFGVKHGVLVTAVQERSAAAAAGFKAGDVVTSLNGSDVSDPMELRQRSARLEDGSDFTAGVVRDHKTMTLKGKMQRPATARRATPVSP